MAQILEEKIVIKMSELAKDDPCDRTTYITQEMLETIESVVQELVPAGIIVEVYMQ